jgi:MFS family permease
VPLQKRAIYIAALSSMFGIASVVGPILGGAFTDKLSWRWCFWINLPFGGVALAAVFFFFSNPPRRHTDMTTREKLRQIDFLGAFFLISAIVCLLLALQWGGTVHAWSDSVVWGCLLGFGLLILTFCGIQYWLGERATMPPRILCRQRTVAACALFSAFLAMALYTHIYYLPFYFQAVKGTSAEGSGIRCIPYLVSITLSSIVVGGLITYLGPYNPPMWGGVVVFTIGSGMLYTLKVNSSVGEWIGYQILAGVGAGACVQIPFIAVQVVLPENDMPIGNAVRLL